MKGGGAKKEKKGVTFTQAIIVKKEGNLDAIRK